MIKAGYGKFIIAHIFVATIVGFIGAAAVHHRRKKLKPSSSLSQHLVPTLDTSGSSSGSGNRKLEKFSDYVARQLGFKDGKDCPQLCKLAYEYFKNSKGCDNSIFDYFGKEADGELLYVKLVEEFDRCILGYLAFHWSQASLMITQVLTVGSDQKRLKDLVMAATRKQRFEKVTKDLRVTRAFSTLVEEMKVIGCGTPKKGGGAESESCTDVMAPMIHSERSPVLLFMGGGMGAGKSTVLKEILKESFWSGAAAKAVVVEADAFKETDVIYRALSSKGHHHDMLQTAELVHQTSTDAASSLLVTALNEGRDVIMDGTLSWEPFVEQTIAMARNVHKHRYRMGVGYKVSEDGTINENYWEQIKEEKDEETTRMKPYRIELVGVVCDPYLAIVRGIRRAIAIRRAVRVNSQITSHKRFAIGFPKYCQLVDNARLYCTNAIGGPPSLIAWKEGGRKLLIEPEEYKWMTTITNLNDEADSIYELYEDPNTLTQPGSVWNNLVLLPTRASVQQELKIAIQRIENPTP